MASGAKNDRVGCPRNDDRRAAQGLVSPRIAMTEEVISKIAHGCGNDAPVEITERFPQELGNLAQNARFPHSHKPIPFPIEKVEERTSDGATRRHINRPLVSRSLGHMADRQE